MFIEQEMIVLQTFIEPREVTFQPLLDHSVGPTYAKVTHTSTA
jgi:hypothetical protein